MLNEMVIDVEERESGKNESRRLRREGRIPAVVYGGDRAPVQIKVDPRSVNEILHGDAGTNTLFTLRLGGADDKKRVVMIREVQRDPIAGRLIHADFVRIDMAREITIKVPLRTVGIAIGVKGEGGILDFVQREVEVSCLPVDIPAAIDVDVSELHVNEHLAAKDLKLPDRVKLVSDPEKTLLVVTTTKEEVAAAPTAEAAAAPAEPEVMKKGKEAAPEEAPAKPEGKGR
jgi:large subunit ribosomal protein L25